jgi:hypothetical protein
MKLPARAASNRILAAGARPVHQDVVGELEARSRISGLNENGGLRSFENVPRSAFAQIAEGDRVAQRVLLWKCSDELCCEEWAMSAPRE